MRRIVGYGMSEEVGLLAFRFMAWVFIFCGKFGVSGWYNWTIIK